MIGTYHNGCHLLRVEGRSLNAAICGLRTRAAMSLCGFETKCFPELLTKPLLRSWADVSTALPHLCGRYDILWRVDEVSKLLMGTEWQTGEEYFSASVAFRRMSERGI